MSPNEIKMKMNGSMETVLDCVIPYIHNGDDLNSISLVSRKFYELDSLTRKHLAVHLLYAPNPSRVSHRFPFIESLTLKGLPFWDFPQISAADITQWIQEISVKFESLKVLHIRGINVCDSDLKLLAKTRGKDLRSLKLCKCQGFSENALVNISEYCNELRTLCLEYNTMVSKGNGEWLRELALRNSVIETFHFRYRFHTYDSNDVTLLAKNCSNSLVSLKISSKPLDDIGDAFRHAIKLEDFDGAIFDEDGDYSSFKFPSSIRCFGVEDLPATSFSLLLPYVNQLRELNLTCLIGNECCQCFLFERCPNLEVLCTDDVCGDMGLRVIGQVCRKLRKLTHYGRVTHMGLIELVQGCSDLEYLDVRLSDISNEAIECVGTHLKNLHDFRMDLEKECITDSPPLDNGIRALLKGCVKLKRLHISLSDGGLTDVGLGYIGKYGLNLRCLFLGCTGESEAGLLELSKGCPKLRKLKLENCPFIQQDVATFVFNIQSLRYLRVQSCYGTVLALTRPTFTAEEIAELVKFHPTTRIISSLVLLTLQLQAFNSFRSLSFPKRINHFDVLTFAAGTPELKPCVTLAKKLRWLAVQLVADESDIGSVKITYTSLRETDDADTPLVDALAAKGICVNEEWVLLDRSSEKPLEIIKVQIAKVKSRLAVSIFESGEIKVEGRVKDGVPYLMKVGVLDVVVSLEENVILCTKNLRNIINILDGDNVIISSMSFGRIAQRDQGVMVIGVDEKPSEEALKMIDEIPDLDEFVFITL